MLQLAWPYAFAALPLPLLLAWLLPRASRQPSSALRVPFFAVLSEFPSRRRARPLTLALATVGWLGLVLAASRPQLLGPPLVVPVSGRDLLLAVDISGSMQTDDMPLGDGTRSRLAAVQQLGDRFIAGRRGDRIGLILFGGQPYLQVPLTLDHATVRRLLDEAEVGLAGQRTSIGDAIGLAVKLLRGADMASKVLILLTDGANNAGVLEPLHAARLAAQIGLRIYTIGVGADSMVVRGLFGNTRINPSADLDEPTLRKIARLTGGRYFRARDSASLAAIYRQLDQLEPVPHADRRLRPVRELYPWPLAAVLAVSVALVWLLAQPPRRLA